MTRRLGIALVTWLAKLSAPPVDWLACLAVRPAEIGTDVLVVRLDAIGDFLLWSDAARRLARHYQAEGRRVILLANATWAELADSLDAFDAVWRLDRRRFLFNPLYRYRLMRKIRRAGFSIAVQPAYSREVLLGDAVVRLAGWRQRIGSTGDLANQTAGERRRADRWYTQRIAAAPDTLMELERNAEFLRGLGIDARPCIGRLPALAKNDRADYFVLFPGASWEAKCWSAANFATLAERVAAATGWHGVIAGGPADRTVAARLLAATSLPLEDLAGHTTLNGLAALLKGARLVIANDTSAVHLAAVVGTPSVCLLGGGHFGRFLPYVATEDGVAPIAVYRSMDCYACNWRCCHPRAAGEAFACIRAIPVDQVWEAVLPLLPEKP